MILIIIKIIYQVSNTDYQLHIVLVENVLHNNVSIQMNHEWSRDILPLYLLYLDLYRISIRRQLIL